MKVFHSKIFEIIRIFYQQSIGNRDWKYEEDKTGSVW